MDNFRRLSKIFKTSFPEYKVSIRRTKLRDGDAGDCDNIKKNEFKIRINRKVNKDEQLLWLIHEWAHVLAWPHKKDHGPEWGRAYARCYNIYLEKFCNEEE